MVYLEYHLETKQVVEIHQNEPVTVGGYDFGKSDDFEVGDEFEQTIWVNRVDEIKNVTSHSAIRNNPNAKRLLQENAKLKAENEVLTESLIDLKTQYMSVPCQYHQDYSVKIDKVLEGVETDGTV
ncbi:hypothetical protein [Bacillus badius]|uniref:Phage protein n=1 Tax=Bacillus badius TaxID=1455 RepID=A0ABR5AZ20_BACBA|nr:hypothetical protein [Bacillus badius]KIL79606.1 hypothetical protein SD77_2060 [Bacillus badius]MED4716301.1 hypothetical protein [Bacillus badius]